MPTLIESPVPGICFGEVEEELAECADDEVRPRIAEIRGGSRHKQRRRVPRIKKDQVEAVKRLIGEFNLDRLEKMTKNEERRPILAIVAEQYSRPVVQEATGIKISENEFSKIRKHARWPGPMQPIWKPRLFRKRVKDSTITALLHCLETGGKLQRNAFGTKVCEILGGQELVTIENIERSIRVSRIAAEFVLELFDETIAEANGDIIVLSDSERCKKLERNSFRRCLCEKGHEGRKCQFTPKGSMSLAKATDLIKLLTGADIKKLSGLDDIKVEQGRENFKNIRTYIDELFGPEESHALKKRVDDVENFHKTDFEHHLERQSDYSCACMTCGFHDKGKSRTNMTERRE